MVIIPSLLIAKILVCLFLLLSILCFLGKNKPYQWKVLPFWLATAPMVLLPILNPFHFFTDVNAFILLFPYMSFCFCLILGVMTKRPSSFWLNWLAKFCL